jgi:phage shock protein PspC (stress-responsive transcriptional regulator)
MAQTRRLYRSRTDRKLAGVCPGLVLYLVLWIVVPEEPQAAA